MTNEQQKEIGRQVSEGFTSGRLDDEQEDGTYQFVAWEITTNEWQD